MNPNPSDAAVSWTLRGASGDVLGTGVSTVPAGGQTAALISQIFPKASQPGWVQGTSSAAGLISFWAGGDFSTFTDGGPPAPISSVATFPLINTDTEISVANLAPAMDFAIFRLADQNGALISTRLVSIPANGVVQGNIASLLPGASVPKSQATSLLVLGLTGASQLAGTSVTKGFLVDTDSVAVNGVMNAGTDLKIPYFVEGHAGGSDYQTVVGVTNLSSTTANVTLTMIIPNSPSVTIQRSIPALGILRGTITDLFNVPTGLGWIQITSSQLVSAWAAYADTIGGGVSMVQAESITSNPLIFGHIADLVPWWTGIVVLNPQSVSADIEVYAMTPDGTVIDGPATSPTARFTLAGMTNRAFLLGDLLPGTQTRTSDGGFVVVRSTNGVPLAGLELFFLRNGKVFANVPSVASPAYSHPAIAAVPPAIDVVSTYSADINSLLQKTNFARGESIAVVMDRTNNLAFPVGIQARYLVTGPSGAAVVDGRLVVSALTGTRTAGVGFVIPQDAPTGVYRLESTASYNGRSSSKTAQFSVTSPVGVVDLVRAYVMDTSNIERISFTAGQTVRLTTDRSNNTGVPVTVPARYKLIGPGNTAYLDITVDSATPTGPRSFVLDVSIPSTIPNGLYTFEASVTYGGATITKTSTFTLTGGAPLSADPEGIGSELERTILPAVEDRTRNGANPERELQPASNKSSQ